MYTAAGIQPQCRQTLVAFSKNIDGHIYTGTIDMDAIQQFHTVMRVSDSDIKALLRRIAITSEPAVTVNPNSLHVREETWI